MDRGEILSKLDYCPDSGIFTWKHSSGSRAKVGEVCGSLANTGYLSVRINKKVVLLHRTAWVIMSGCAPSGLIDHINGDKTDNRWVNLREANRSQNGTNRNIGAMTNIYVLPGGSFNVKLKKERKSIGFGTYKDLELAQLVRDEARLKLFGEYCGR